MYCEHVYKVMGVDTCPKCGGATHEINWKELNEAHQKWVAENPNFKYTWWSI